MDRIIQAIIITGVGFIFLCLAYCKWLDIKFALVSGDEQ